MQEEIMGRRRTRRIEDEFEEAEYGYDYGDELDMRMDRHGGGFFGNHSYGHHGYGRQMMMRPPSPKRPKLPP